MKKFRRLIGATIKTRPLCWLTSESTKLGHRGLVEGGRDVLTVRNAPAQRSIYRTNLVKASMRFPAIRGSAAPVARCREQFHP